MWTASMVLERLLVIFVPWASPFVWERWWDWVLIAVFGAFCALLTGAAALASRLIWRAIGARGPGAPLAVRVTGLSVVVAALAAIAAQGYTFVDTTCGARVDAPWDNQYANGRELTSVIELPASERKRLVEFKLLGLPAVVRGALNDTTVDMEMWHPHWLADTFGGMPIEVQLGNVEQADKTHIAEIPFDELMRGMQDPAWVEAHRRADGRVPYVAEDDSMFYEKLELVRAAHRIMTEMGVGGPGATAALPEPFLLHQQLFWLGPAGARTGLHSDIDPFNVLHQMYGHKTVWMIPISQSPLLYPSTKYDYGAGLSHVDPFEPDLERFPKYANVTPIAVTIYPGDALFVPSGWYHYAEADTVSVSVSLRLTTMCEALSVAPRTVLFHLHEWGIYRPWAGCVCHRSDEGDDEASVY